MFRVDLEAMATSAAQLNGQSEDFANEHASASNRIAAAQAGWRGTSALALGAASTRWAQTSDVLLERLSTHSQDLFGTAQLVSESEDRHAVALRALGSPSGSAAL